MRTLANPMQVEADPPLLLQPFPAAEPATLVPAEFGRWDPALSLNWQLVGMLPINKVSGSGCKQW